MVTVVVIDSRSKTHPHWVELCLNSIKNQSVDVELIIVPNYDRKITIGECWNTGIRQASGEFIFFVGDDCWIARDCVQVMLGQVREGIPCVTTYMTMYDDDPESEGKHYTTVQRPCTGMWRRDYLLKYPFNENLTIGIDREYFEEAIKRGDNYNLVFYYYGHFDRRHHDHRSGKVRLKAPEKKVDIYVSSSGGTNFIAPLVKRWKETKEVFSSSQPFDPNIKTDIIWVEWANKNAAEIGDYGTKTRKFLRLHAYEAYTPQIHYINFKKYEKVIFISEHIKYVVEQKVGEIPNSVVIPVGIELDKFSMSTFFARCARDNGRNNKIAYAGQISRKKGAGELMFLAKSLPEYEFHIAGKYIEDDVADYFNNGKPDNLFIHPFTYNLNEWLQDYTYFINTSMREGNPIATLEAMACGLKPLVRDWLGAEEIYGEYVYKNLDDLKRLLNGSYEPEKYRKFVEDNYDFENTYKEIEKLLEVVYESSEG